MTIKTAVVVGAGQAGAWVVQTLRTEGYDGRVVLIGEEPYPPYERPPLSKDVLAGKFAAETTYLMQQHQLNALNIDWWASERVSRLDIRSKAIECESGKSLSYDIAFLATGGVPKTLASLPAGNRVHYLRDITDAQRLGKALGRASSLLVVGGGWIGLEVASTARQAGKTVTVIEAGPRLCGRSLPPVIAARLADLHRKSGVTLHLGISAEFEVSAENVSAHLPDGSVLTADIAVVGIGMSPRVDLAAAAGLQLDNGVVVDDQGRTSDPSVFAVGDVASFPGENGGPRIRFESWANAQNSAIVAARAALGLPDRYNEIPWFWSDQFGVNIQVLGIVPDNVEPVVRDYGSGKCSLFFLKERHLCSLVAINSGRDVKLAKRWMVSRVPLEAEVLEDVSLNLQKISR